MKMKKIGLLLSVVALFLATSCTDKDAYSIKGKVANASFEGKQIYLQELNADGRGFTSIDTATIENGSFIFKGKAGEVPAVRFVAIADPTVMPSLFILEAGNIELNIDTVPFVKGTPMNDKYQEFSTKNNEASKKMRSLGEQFQKASMDGTMTPELDKQINDDYDAAKKELGASIFEYIKANIQNPIGEFFFLSSGNALEPEQMKELLSMVKPEFKQNEQIQELDKYLTALDNSAVGKQFIDVKGKTPEGKEVALSDYAGKGKYVLIDFWASWCGPCIKEMPTVVEAYKKYSPKGFEVVGISLDQDGEAWAKSIKDLNITWPQMSDLKGWQSELSAPYGVRSIPHTILLDQDGKIIEKNLRGEELLSKLEELMK